MEKVFSELIRIIDILRSPEGCPWDREQTPSSMRASLIEETYEVIDAIDTKNTENLKEEIGDLFFVTCFVAYLAQQEGLFTIEDMIRSTTHKLIRRHPHVFSERQTITVDGVLQNWETIKSNEKTIPEHPLRSIPRSLPELQRLQKILSKMKRLRFSPKPIPFQSITEEVARIVHQDPAAFFKGFLLYAFENNLDLPSLIRELSNELIEHFDKQNQTKS